MARLPGRASQGRGCMQTPALTVTTPQSGDRPPRNFCGLGTIPLCADMGATSHARPPSTQDVAGPSEQLRLMFLHSDLKATRGLWCLFTQVTEPLPWLRSGGPTGCAWLQES